MITRKALAPLNLQIGRITPAHLPAALRLSQAEGWPHRLEDYALALSVSDGFVALDGDAVVGTALCTVFGRVAALNMIIVDARMRGQGLGRRLMEAAMALAGPREMRLTATADGRPLYEKLGFAATGRIMQHQGIARAATPDLAARLAIPSLPVTTAGPDDIAWLALLDLEASGLERRALLARIAEQGTVLSAEHGFALLREFGRGHVLGPVVARDADTARALIAEGARRCAGRFLRIDLPEAHGLSGFATALGLEAAGGGTAMVHKPGLHAPGGYTTFALASQAFG